MIDCRISIINGEKSFGRRNVFKNLSFEFYSGNILGISGRNGSGKSTLLKCLAGVISFSSGSIDYYKNDKPIPSKDLINSIGFCAPYLNLYDEFSAIENLTLSLKIRGFNPDINKIEFFLKEFGIFNRKNDSLKNYSSGMKQRLKLIFAFLHNPSFLLLDEPSINLDDSGKIILYNFLEKELKNRVIIMASNEKSDLNLCRRILNMENFKTVAE